MGILQLVLGAILAVAGGFCAKWFSDWRDGRNMLPALAAEIQAMLRMLEQERFIPALEGEIEWLENTRTPREFNITFKNTYNIVFAASASKLGLISRAKTHDFWRRDSDLLRDLVTVSKIKFNKVGDLFRQDLSTWIYTGRGRSLGYLATAFRWNEAASTSHEPEA